MQRLTTCPYGELTAWGNSRNDTLLTDVLAGLGPDDPVISLNYPGDNDYVDVANEEDPFDYVMRDDLKDYQKDKEEAGAQMKLILFSEYKRLAADAVDQYIEFIQGATGETIGCQVREKGE